MLLKVVDPKDEAKACAKANWFPLMKRFHLKPHHQHYLDLQQNPREATHVRLTIFPDGGVSRLRVLGTVMKNLERRPNVPNVERRQSVYPTVERRKSVWQ